MQSVANLSSAEARNISFLLSDVDDTITTQGKLHPVALDALYRLQEAGLRTICVTGGSAGWADTYLRQWPVEAVLSESGAVCLYREKGAIRHFVHPSIVEEGYRQRMEQMIERVLFSVDGAKLSSDQFARLFDVAFDHGSEPPFLGKEGIARIVDICKEMGASTAVSSIHVNAWFGSFDKYEGSKAFFSRILGIEEEAMVQSSCFCGDAPNDQVMFAKFPLSFGVGTIKKRAAEMQFLPSYVAENEGGEGFAEIVDVFLKKRGYDL